MVSVGEQRPPGTYDREIDATGQWVMPGFLDTHTHYDAELLAEPGIVESVRHGVTTVFVGSCSLGTVLTSPLDGADLFSRVEALPHESVLEALKPTKPGPHPRNGSRPWRLDRWVRMWRHSWGIPICGPP